MNKYLEKVASWKNPRKFVGYVTGKYKRNAQTKLNNVKDYLAKKESVQDVADHLSREAKQTTKARTVAGAAGAAGVAGAAYGYKRVRDKQDRETAEQYRIMFKEGSAVSEGARAIAHEGGSAITNTLKRIGKITADTMNSAGGGKIKDYATRQGFKVGTKEYKGFVAGNKTHQVRELLRKQNVTKTNTGPQTRKGVVREHIEHLNSLHREQRNARISLGSTGAAAISAYGWKKSRDAAKKNNPYM